MALRFLADHCVSNSTVQTLREAQHEVFRLRDVLPVDSSDAIVLAKAQEIDAVLISPPQQNLWADSGSGSRPSV